VVGRRLSADERASYDLCPDRLAQRVRIVSVPVLPGGYAGMTLGRWILLARPVHPDGSSSLLAHELVHVRQWAELGVVGFAARYLASFGRGLRRHRRWNEAYRRIGLEVAARRETERWARRADRSGRRRREPLA
jgi:hypothetical protein